MARPGQPTGPPPGDEELVLAMQAGDRVAVAALYDRYAEPLHGFCVGMLRDRHEAADATQDVFLVAVQKIGQLRDPSRVRPWLYAIARNECIRRGRLRARHDLGAEVAEMASHEPDLTAGIGAEEASALLWAAADGLDERDRLLLELSVRHGLDGADLADAAGIRPGQVSMAVGRMRERVERSLGALLVARQGDPTCPELRDVLAGWDGTFTVLMRKRVARHVDGCLVCDEQRAGLVAPLASLSAIGFLPVVLPADLRARVIAAVDHLVGGATGGPGAADGTWLASGFPPGLGAETGTGAGTAGSGKPAGSRRSRRRRAVAVLAAVAAILLVLAIAASADRDDGPTDLLAAGAATTTTVGSIPAQAGTDQSDAVAPAAPGQAGPPTSGQQLAPVPGGGAGATSAGPPDVGTAPPPTAPPDPAPASTVPGAVPPTPAPPGSPTTRPTTTVPPTPPPGDPPRPAVTTTTVVDRPPVIRGAALGTRGPLRTASCRTGPHQTSVVATAVDDVGVTAVTLVWTQAGGPSGMRPLTLRAGRWHGTLGPFDAGGSVTWRVVATDAAGAATTSPPASIAVDPCPG